MDDPIEAAKRGYRTASIISFAMVAAVLIYGVATYFLANEHKSLTIHPVKPMLKYSLLFISIAGIFVARSFFDQIFFRADDAAVGFSGQKPSRVQKLLTVCIIKNAVAEMPAIFGLFFSFLNGNFYEFIPFAVLSLIGFALFLPQKEDWARRLGLDF